MNQYPHLQGRLESRILSNIINIVRTNTIKNNHFLFHQKQAQDIIVKQYINMIPDLRLLIIIKEAYCAFYKSNTKIYLSQTFLDERRKMGKNGYAQWLNRLIDNINVYQEYFSHIQRLNKFLQNEGKSIYSYLNNEKYKLFQKSTSQFLVQLINNQYDLLQSKNIVFQLLSWPQIKIQLNPQDPLSINIRKMLLLISNLVKQIFQSRRKYSQSYKQQDLIYQYNMMQQQNQKLKQIINNKSNQYKHLQNLLNQKDKILQQQFLQYIKINQQNQIKFQQLINKLKQIKKQIILIQQQNIKLRQSINTQDNQKQSQKNEKIQNLNFKIIELQQFIINKQQQKSTLQNYINNLLNQNKDLNRQINHYDNKFLILQQNATKLSLQNKDIKNKYEELMMRFKSSYNQVRESKVDQVDKKNRSQLQLYECQLQALKVQNSLLVFQLNQMKEDKDRLNQQFNNQMLLKDDMNKHHLAQIEQLQANYNIRLQQQLNKLAASLEASCLQKIRLSQETKRKQLQLLQIKLVQAQNQRQDYKQKYYIELNKIFKKQVNKSRSRQKQKQKQICNEGQPKNQSFNLINVLDNSIIQIQIFQSQKNNLQYNPKILQQLKDEQYSKIIHPEDIQHEDDNSSMIKDFQTSIRKQTQKQIQKISEQNQLLKSQIIKSQNKIKQIQIINIQFKQNLNKLQLKNKQLIIFLQQKQLQNKQKQMKINKLIKINQDYQKQLNNYIQSKKSMVQYNKPQLIHVEELLFNSDIFKLTPSYYKSNLIKHVQKYVNSQIVRTQLLHKYDPYNKANFHLYIDQKEYFLCLVKTANAVIAGFYPGKINDKQLLSKGGLLISISKDESFALKRNKHNDKSVYKGMVYDKYYIIFGNAQLRIKTGQKKIFSNFGINSGFYDYQNAKDKRLNYFLSNGDQKQCQFEYCECYQIFFDSSIDLKSNQNHNIFQTY